MNTNVPMGHDAGQPTGRTPDGTRTVMCQNQNQTRPESLVLLLLVVLGRISHSSSLCEAREMNEKSR